jgi:hypothetical protein
MGKPRRTARPPCPRRLTAFALDAPPRNSRLWLSVKSGLRTLGWEMRSWSAAGHTAYVSRTLTAMESEGSVDVGPRPSVRRFSGFRWVAVIALVSTGLFAAHVWYQGGTRLELASAGLGVHAVPVGRAVSFGVGLTTSGGPSVVVEAANSKHSANVSVHYAIIRRGPHQLGIGTADGTIAGSTPLGTNGIRVAQPAQRSPQTVCTVPPIGASSRATCTEPRRGSQPDHGSTWLVVTVTARSPGPWSVTHITVRYHSWWRTRTATSGYVVSGRASAPS